MFTKRLSKSLAGPAVLGCAALLASGQAFAHHSYAAFDMTRATEVQGTVKSFLWANPHSLLVLSGTAADGNVVDMNMEMNGPGYLVPNGWKRDSLKAGDKVTVTIHPLRDGMPGGDLVKVAFADGRPALSAQIKPPPGVLVPSAPAAAPQGEKR